MSLSISDVIALYSQCVERNLTKPDILANQQVRKKALNECTGGLVKVAFDTRRIHQDTDYNPRRNLQNYHRSEQLISESQLLKKNGFTRLYHVCSELKNKYQQEPEWQDSYCRVLYNTLHNALRIDTADGDFSDTANSVGSWDYVEEMLYARYRLDATALESYSENKLQDIILSKDSALVNKHSIAPVKISKQEIRTESYDSLMDKLFGNIKASASNPKVKRTVTITVEDSIDDNDIVKY